MTGEGSSPKSIASATKRIPFEATEGPPIFVVGNGRSGTTLMELMLSAHPRIYICHELAFYPWFSRALAGGRVEDYLEPYFTTMNFRWLRLRPEDVLNRLPAELPRSEAWRVFEVIMRMKAASVGRVRYGDKSPPHIWYLNSIFRDFPEARVITMVRDPRSEIDSVSRMPWGCSKDLPNCVINELTRRFIERNRDKLLIVRLEDLQSNPRIEMERVLAFVGEAWDDAVLDHPNNDPDPGRLPDVPWFTSSGSSIQRQDQPWVRLSPERLATIETLCRKSMDLHGYKPADLPGKPGKFATAMNIISSVPETFRYMLAYLRVASYFKDPDHWDWYDEKGRDLTKKLNPPYWEERGDFTFPEAPTPEAETPDPDPT